MKNIFKPTLTKLILILTLLSFSNKSWAQGKCCNNDTIYFVNEVDCPICINMECYDPNSGTGTPLYIFIFNDTPLIANPPACPSLDCRPYTFAYISCGSNINPQRGKILITPPGNCQNCPALKFTLYQLNNIPLTPPLVVISSNNPPTNTYMNSNCCDQNTPNLQMSFDCATKTLSLKCVQ